MLSHVHKMVVTPLGETPSKEDIKEAIDYALHFACIVELAWWIKYNGYYSTYIYANDNVENVLQNRIPYVCGV